MSEPFSSTSSAHHFHHHHHPLPRPPSQTAAHSPRQQPQPHSPLSSPRFSPKPSRSSPQQVTLPVLSRSVSHQSNATNHFASKNPHHHPHSHPLKRASSSTSASVFASASTASSLSHFAVMDTTAAAIAAVEATAEDDELHLHALRVLLYDARLGALERRVANDRVLRGLLSYLDASGVHDLVARVEDERARDVYATPAHSQTVPQVLRAFRAATRASKVEKRIETILNNVRDTTDKTPLAVSASAAAATRAVLDASHAHRAFHLAAAHRALASWPRPPPVRDAVPFSVNAHVDQLRKRARQLDHIPLETIESLRTRPLVRSRSKLTSILKQPPHQPPPSTVPPTHGGTTEYDSPGGASGSEQQNNFALTQTAPTGYQGSPPRTRPVVTPDHNHDATGSATAGPSTNARPSSQSHPSQHAAPYPSDDDYDKELYEDDRSSDPSRHPSVVANQQHQPEHYTQDYDDYEHNELDSRTYPAQAQQPELNERNGRRLTHASAMGGPSVTFQTDGHTQQRKRVSLPSDENEHEHEHSMSPPGVQQYARVGYGSDETAGHGGANMRRGNSRSRLPQHATMAALPRHRSVPSFSLHRSLSTPGTGTVVYDEDEEDEEQEEQEEQDTYTRHPLGSQASSTYTAAHPYGAPWPPNPHYYYLPPYGQPYGHFPPMYDATPLHFPLTERLLRDTPSRVAGLRPGIAPGYDESYEQHSGGGGSSGESRSRHAARRGGGGGDDLFFAQPELPPAPATSTGYDSAPESIRQMPSSSAARRRRASFDADDYDSMDDERGLSDEGATGGGRKFQRRLVTKGKKAVGNIMNFAQSDHAGQFTSAFMEHGGLEPQNKNPLHKVSKVMKAVTGREEEPTKASLVGQAAGLALSGARARMTQSDGGSTRSRSTARGGRVGQFASQAVEFAKGQDADAWGELATNALQVWQTSQEQKGARERERAKTRGSSNGNGGSSHTRGRDARKVRMRSEHRDTESGSSDDRDRRRRHSTATAPSRLTRAASRSKNTVRRQQSSASHDRPRKSSSRSANAARQQSSSKHKQRRGRREQQSSDDDSDSGGGGGGADLLQQALDLFGSATGGGGGGGGGGKGNKTTDVLATIGNLVAGGGAADSSDDDERKGNRRRNKQRQRQSGGGGGGGGGGRAELAELAASAIGKMVAPKKK